MAIEVGLRDKLATGTKLVARYRGAQYVAEVVATPDGKRGFRLEDGRTFKSPSAAASAVMNGQAANGWRFWSLEGEQPANAARPSRTRAAAAAQTTGASATKAPLQCGRCGKTFVGPAQLAHHEANADRLCIVP